MDINQIEEERKGRLNQARKAVGLAKDVASAVIAKNPKAILSLGKRFGKHWPILIVAAIFDLVALIPFISVVVNFCFGGVMFLYFGRKRVVMGIIAPKLPKRKNFPAPPSILCGKLGLPFRPDTKGEGWGDGKLSSKSRLCLA